MDRRSFLRGVAAAGGLMGSNIPVGHAAAGKNTPKPGSGGFQYRVGYLWLPQMSSRRFPTVFSSELDDALIEDYSRYLPCVREAGFNYITIAGLIAENGPMQFPVDLDRGFSPQRDKQIHEMIRLIHANGLKFLAVIGVYSWGFRNIIAAHPEVISRHYKFRGITHYSRRNNSILLDEYDRLEEGETPVGPEIDIMCASREESWQWQERVMRFMLERYDLDGFHFESADRGRCWCPECRRIENITYHARINERTTALVKQLAPEKVIGVNSGGLLLEATRDLPALKQMVHRADYFADSTEYSLKTDVVTENQYAQGTWFAERPAIAKAIAPVAMGEFIHHRDGAMDRSTWFIPAPQSLVRIIRRAYHEGCRAAEYYCRGAFSNPSRELNNYMIGHSLTNPEQAAEAVLEDIIDQLYQPESMTVRAGLAGLFMKAEMSCMANDVMFNMYHQNSQDGSVVNPVPYLTETPLFKQLRYLRELEQVFLPEARKIAPGLGSRERADSLVKSIEGTANTVRAYVDKQLAG